MNSFEICEQDFACVVQRLENLFRDREDMWSYAICPDGSRPLTKEQLAEELGLTPDWFYEQTRNRAKVRNEHRFPFYKIGKYLRFCLSEVAKWFQRHKVQ